MVTETRWRRITICDLRMFVNLHLLAYHISIKFLLNINVDQKGRTERRSWLRQALQRQSGGVAGSIPDWVVGVFNLLKPSGFLTYRQVKHSKILRGASFALSVFVRI